MNWHNTVCIFIKFSTYRDLFLIRFCKSTFIWDYFISQFNRKKLVQLFSVIKSYSHLKYHSIHTAKTDSWQEIFATRRLSQTLWIFLAHEEKLVYILYFKTLPSLNSQLLLLSMTSDPASTLWPELVTSCSLQSKQHYHYSSTHINNSLELLWHLFIASKKFHEF